MQKKDNQYQIAPTKELTFETNSLLTVSENGCEEQKLAQLTTALATTVISRLLFNTISATVNR